MYAIVNKLSKKKADRSQLYSKVDKSKKRGAGEPADGDGIPTVCDVSLPIPEDSSSHITPEVHKSNAGVSELAYEPFESSKVDDYDTVGDDFGYDSVGVVTEKCAKSSASLKRASEHVYDVVPDDPSDSTDLKGYSSDDYEDIVVIST